MQLLRLATLKGIFLTRGHRVDFLHSWSFPQKFFWLLGSQMVHSSAILVIVLKSPYPLPFKKFSLQIYTDLKNGPGSWKKSEIRLV